MKGVRAGLLWVWPTAVSLNSLGAGPREEDIPILPEAEVRSGVAADVHHERQICMRQKQHKSTAAFA